jgi:hypothetical protein
MRAFGGEWVVGRWDGEDWNVPGSDEPWGESAWEIVVGEPVTRDARPPRGVVVDNRTRYPISIQVHAVGAVGGSVDRLTVVIEEIPVRTDEAVSDPALAGDEEA